MVRLNRSEGKGVEGLKLHRTRSAPPGNLKGQADRRETLKATKLLSLQETNSLGLGYKTT